jgi:protein gp37
MSVDWVRQLRDETKAAGRAFFFKQWGGGLFSKAYVKDIGRTLDGREWNESPGRCHSRSIEKLRPRQCDLLSPIAFRQ